MNFVEFINNKAKKKVLYYIDTHKTLKLMDEYEHEESNRDYTSKSSCNHIKN